ncbi:MAG: MauE/DoxX family redox-associated membrane protein [Woeseiaceae bacterium]
MLDPLIVKAISIGLGLMFLLAGFHKFAEGAQFRITLLEYQVLPESLVSVASRIIPIVEFLLGGAWLVGYYSAGMTAIASAALLGIYALAIGINIGRGRVHFDCGCGFGGKSENEQYLSGGLIVRNIVLMGAALATLLPVGSRNLGFGDYLILVAALLAGGLLFGAANQLLANRAAINTWRKGND